MSSPVLTGFWSCWFFGVNFGRHISFESSSSSYPIQICSLCLVKPGQPSVFGAQPLWAQLFGFTHPVLSSFFGVFSAFFHGFVGFFATPVTQPMMVIIHAHGMVAAKSSNVVVQMLSKQLDFKKVHSVQFVPGGWIRVTFTCLEYRNLILARKSPQIDDLHHLNVTESDAPVTNVYVHYLPVEAGDIGIRLGLAPFGKVHEVSHQQFAGFKGITTGTRIVRISINQHIPFQCDFQGYPCHV